MDKTQIEALLARIDVWLLVFGVIVVIGVGGESFFGIRHWWNSRKLQALQRASDLAQERAIADARKDAAEANEKANSFQLQIAQANERAAKAEKETAELRDKMKGRRLSAIQKTKLSALLKPFAPAMVTLEFPGTPVGETADLGSDFSDAIAMAGIPISSANRMFNMGEAWRGVFLRVGDDRKAEAEVIADFLIEVGLATRPVRVQSKPDKAYLSICIGDKPN